MRATAILAQWGGEEFLIRSHVSGPNDDLLMAERLRLSLTQDTLSVSLDAGSSLSRLLGVVRYPFSERSLQALDVIESLPRLNRLYPSVFF